MKIDTDDVIAEAKEKGWPIGNEATIKELVFEWKDGLERIINNKDRKKEVGHIDVLMALSNFVRLVVEDLEERGDFSSLEKKCGLRGIVLKTIERGLMRRLMQ